MSSFTSTSASSFAIEVVKGLHTIETRNEGISISVLQQELQDARRRENYMAQEIDKLGEKCSELDSTARRMSAQDEAARQQCASRATQLQALQGELEGARRKLSEAEQRVARYRAEKFKAEREVQDIQWDQSKRDNRNDSRLRELQKTASCLKCAYQSAFALNKESEDLCTCLQLRLKAKSEKILNLQNQNSRLKQSLNCRITELMQQDESREEDTSTDGIRSAYELARENELLKGRVQFLAKLLMAEGHTDLGENKVEKSLYDRIVAELRTLEVMKADQDTKITRLIAGMARLQDTSNAFGLDISERVRERFCTLEAKSLESRRNEVGKRGSKSISQRRSGVTDCVPQ